MAKIMGALITAIFVGVALLGRGLPDRAARVIACIPLLESLIVVPVRSRSRLLARLHFRAEAGKVVRSIQTKIVGVVATPSNGWVRWVHRSDSGDLLACENDGTIYTIDFSILCLYASNEGGR